MIAEPGSRSDSRADVVALIAVTAAGAALIVNPFFGLPWANLGWAERIGTFARLGAAGNAFVVLLAVLVVYFGSSDERLTLTARLGLAGAMFVGGLLVVASIAQMWVSVAIYSGAWATRLQSAATSWLAAIVASLAAWLAFRGVIIGDTAPSP